MKYTYAYKTSDGVRHEGTMKASSREEVFAELRKQGIKAIKVVAADGSKANGEVRGIRKRAVAVLVVLVAGIADIVLAVACENLHLGITYTGLLLPLVLTWYIITELGSILENAVKLGASVPDWLTKMLKVSLGTVDKLGNSQTSEQTEE